MKIFSFILFFIIPILLKSQSYNWINKCGTIWIDDSKLCGDANGNYYLYGTVGHGLSQGYFYFDNDSTRYYGLGDIFVSKIDSSGSIVWSRTFGSHSNGAITEGGSAFYDVGSNSIFINCFISDPDVYFGNLFFQNNTPPGRYIAKLNANGSFEWAKPYLQDIY